MPRFDYIKLYNTFMHVYVIATRERILKKKDEEEEEEEEERCTSFCCCVAVVFWAYLFLLSYYAYFL